MKNEELLKLAEEVKCKAYAPYSKFKVGAAIISLNDQIFTGCNVENISYGLTICAERNAIFRAVSEGVTDFAMIAITADTAEPIIPCGACLQVLSEFSPEINVIMAGPDGSYIEKKLHELLPHKFEM